MLQQPSGQSWNDAYFQKQQQHQSAQQQQQLHALPFSPPNVFSMTPHGGHSAHTTTSNSTTNSRAPPPHAAVSNNNCNNNPFSNHRQGPNANPKSKLMATTTTAAFTAGKGFDPNSFYGEDEEEEEDEGDNDDDDAQQQGWNADSLDDDDDQQNGWNTDSHNPAGNSATAKATTFLVPPPTADDDGWDLGSPSARSQNSTTLQPPTGLQREQQQENGALSTNDLLHLFGVGGSSQGLENIINSSNIMVGDNLQGHPGPKTSSTSGATTTAAGEGDFELRAPSDSSSDEED
jgi:hypothetical protein